MTTDFPEFTRLSSEHRPQIDALGAQLGPYADYSFTNLYTWSPNGGNEVAMNNGNLLVRLPDYMTGKTTMYGIFGGNNVDESLDLLLGVSDSVSLVPEEVVNCIQDPGRFTITPERDQYDYLYDVRILAALPGANLKKKRNKVNRFVDDFGSRTTTETVSVPDVPVSRDITQLFEKWARDCHKAAKECETERRAIQRMLTNSELLNLQITLVRIDNTLYAFSVNEIVANGSAICHFEKALPLHEGLYAFVINQAAKNLAEQGVSQVNWQQDLGLPGLRQAKTSYHPTGFLRKYTISRPQ
jgi:hypothetical protein